jgi:ribonuclease R
VPFGLFVRIPALHVDGLVHVSALPADYYHRDGSGTVLSGERSGRQYRLLDHMRVRLSHVDLEQRKIDFVPLDATGEPTGRKPQRKQQRKQKGRGR